VKSPFGTSYSSSNKKNGPSEYIDKDMKEEEEEEEFSEPEFIAPSPKIKNVAKEEKKETPIKKETKVKKEVKKETPQKTETKTPTSNSKKDQKKNQKEQPSPQNKQADFWRSLENTKMEDLAEVDISTKVETTKSSSQPIPKIRKSIDETPPSSPATTPMKSSKPPTSSGKKGRMTRSASSPSPSKKRKNGEQGPVTPQSEPKEIDMLTPTHSDNENDSNENEMD